MDFRSSRSQVFYNIDVLKIYEKFTVEQLCQILFPEPPACNFIEKEAPAQVFLTFTNKLYPETT